MVPWTPTMPWRGGVVRLVALVAVGMLCLALAVVAVPVLLDLTACSAAQRRVFAEVPHHGGAHVAVHVRRD
jgi:hypothetical protein